MRCAHSACKSNNHLAPRQGPIDAHDRLKNTLDIPKKAHRKLQALATSTRTSSKLDGNPPSAAHVAGSTVRRWRWRAALHPEVCCAHQISWWHAIARQSHNCISCHCLFSTHLKTKRANRRRPMAFASNSAEESSWCGPTLPPLATGKHRHRTPRQTLEVITPRMPAVYNSTSPIQTYRKTIRTTI